MAHENPETGGQTDEQTMLQSESMDLPQKLASISTDQDRDEDHPSRFGSSLPIHNSTEPQ